jgi:hypothetical protein
VGTPEGKKLFESPRHKWVSNNNNLKETGMAGERGDWTGFICLRIGTGAGLL